MAPVEDIDKGQLDDPYANAEYAKDIFEYMQEREVPADAQGRVALPPPLQIQDSVPLGRPEKRAEQGVLT